MSKGNERVPRATVHAGGLRAAIRIAALAVACVCGGLVVAVASSASSAPALKRRGGDGLGIRPGKIKHVWLIILENKSYDATFTGLNNNTYLWQTLPSQGVLLKNYYGTGHFSQDNYITMVSGQATISDTQEGCPYYAWIRGHVDRSGSLHRNPNYGQMRSAAGPNAPPGANGCVYPSSVRTLFNQFDAAGVSWKGYAQDLGNPDAEGSPHSAGARFCGAPYRTPGRIGTKPNPGNANATDQYVARHFPFPWFGSLLRSGDCNSRHIANVFDRNHGLYHDLQREARTPAFSWITPNLCSDAHDAVCAGNNLSGGFSGPNTPKPPVNYSGGLYAADLFLEHIIPEIEASPAFRDGGLIDVTFDEAFPPFTYTYNSFANSTTVRPDALASIVADTAGETLFGRGVHWEPQGPNTPLRTNARGDQLYPGDGFNSVIDRDTSITGLVLGGGQPIGGGANGGARSDKASGAPGSATIADNEITLRDVGRSVTDTTDPGSPIPANCVVAHVIDTPVTATAPIQAGGFVDAGSFSLTCNGVATAPTSTVTKINLGPETAATDPLFDATHATNGGGDTGSVLISPYIRPGTISKRLYNHYSWLRTMEDLFNVASASGGLDGRGHLGYAAQPGLAPFGRDVFNNPWGQPKGTHRVTKSGDTDWFVPAWLGPGKVPVGRVVTATSTNTWLAIQGDTVRVKLPRAGVVATVSGPAVPRQGHLQLPITSPCTFTVTLTDPSAPIAITSRQFAAIDEQGRLHSFKMTSQNDGQAAREVRPGQTVELKLYAVLPFGQGRITWSPVAGKGPLVQWDFDVEIN